MTSRLLFVHLGFSFPFSAFCPLSRWLPMTTVPCPGPRQSLAQPHHLRGDKRFQRHQFKRRVFERTSHNPVSNLASWVFFSSALLLSGAMGERLPGDTWGAPAHTSFGESSANKREVGNPAASPCVPAPPKPGVLRFFLGLQVYVGSVP